MAYNSSTRYFCDCTVSEPCSTACKLMAVLSAEMEEGRASLLKFIRQCKMRFLHLVGESCVEQRCL